MALLGALAAAWSFAVGAASDAGAAALALVEAVVGGAGWTASAAGGDGRRRPCQAPRAMSAAPNSTAPVNADGRQRAGFAAPGSGASSSPDCKASG